jgi:hypothetical protein
VEVKDDLRTSRDALWLCNTCTERADEASAALAAASNGKTRWPCVVCQRDLRGPCSECYSCKQVCVPRCAVCSDGRNDAEHVVLWWW